MNYLSLLIALCLCFPLLHSAQAQEQPLILGSNINLGLVTLVAKNEGLFPKHGLKVDYRKFQTGKMTMDALIAGEVEVGTLVDSNIAFVNYSDNPIKVIASIGTKLDDAIYFKKHSQITKPADLIGKRIGYAPATSSHIFLARLLERNKIPWADIKPVQLQPQAMEAALRNDSVDAVSIWQPWGNNIENSFRESVSNFSNNKDIYTSTVFLATTEKIIKNKPDALKKLLVSLIDAKERYYNNPQQVHAYLATEIGVSAKQVSTVLSHFSPNIIAGSSALPLIRENGSWIKQTQENFKDQLLPDYTKAFDDQFIKLLLTENTEQHRTVQSISFCRINTMIAALLHIADAKGYFKSQGIDASFITATNGKICQDMLLARQADYAIVAEAAFTYLAASNPPFKIFAMLGQNPELAISARKDRGVSRFEDLRGKRVAYLPGTSSFFFLMRVLKKFNIPRTEIKLTSMQPPTMPAALLGGSIDAFSLWEPWSSQAKALIPDNVIEFSGAAVYQSESLLVGHSHALNTSPEIPVKILRALIEAEAFLLKNNEEAFAILSKAIAFEPVAFKRLWPDYKLGVQIAERPINLLDENFKLLQESDTNFKDLPLPDFKSYVDSSFLKQIDPERVEF